MLFWNICHACGTVLIVLNHGLTVLIANLIGGYSVSHQKRFRRYLAHSCATIFPIFAKHVIFPHTRKSIVISKCECTLILLCGLLFLPMYPPMFLPTLSLPPLSAQTAAQLLHGSPIFITFALSLVKTGDACNQT